MGIVAAVANSIFDQGCNIVESAQSRDPETDRFVMRVAFSAPGEMTGEWFKRTFQPVAEDLGLKSDFQDLAVRPRVMTLVSQCGHCLNDLFYLNAIGQLPLGIVSVGSNHDSLGKLVKDVGIEFIYLPESINKADREKQLINFISGQRIDLEAIAPYIQLLSTRLSMHVEFRGGLSLPPRPCFGGQAHPGDRPMRHPRSQRGAIIEREVERVDLSMLVD